MNQSVINEPLADSLRNKLLDLRKSITPGPWYRSGRLMDEYDNLSISIGPTPSSGPHYEETIAEVYQNKDATLISVAPTLLDTVLYLDQVIINLLEQVKQLTTTEEKYYGS